MQLEKLTIEMKTYGDHKGKYIANVVVGERGSTIMMELPPDVSAVIVRDCIDHLCRATDAAAHEMKERLVASLPPALPLHNAKAEG